MAAKEVSVALCGVDSVPKDVYTAVVFKEEAVEHEGKPGDCESGKNLLFSLEVFAIKAVRKMPPVPRDERVNNVF